MHYVSENGKNREKYLIPQFKNNLPSVMPAVYERFTKEELEEVIESNYGIITVICSILDCTYKQFYKALDYYDLRQFLIDSKQQLVGMAEEAIIDCLKSKNHQAKMRAAELTLKSLGKNSGWNVNDQPIITQEININEKETEIKNIFGIS